MAIDESLVEIREYAGEGYQPLVDYGAWRVAILRYTSDLLPENIADMQRHDETDEVFVLLAGKCILFVAEGKDAVAVLHGLDMEPMKLYNVKKAVWHNHALSKDAVVLVIENSDTTYGNSPRVSLSCNQQDQIVALGRTMWNR